MNVLVTGATGFIGRVVVSRLVKDGNRVVAVVRDKRKAETVLGKEIEIWEVDVGDWASVQRINPSHKVNAVFHLAASLRYFGDNESLHKTNVDGTVNLCRWAAGKNVERFVFASSIEAMGTVSSEDVPVDESHPCRPVSSYGRSKLEAEGKVLEWNRKGLFDAIILRFGNVYGPGSPFLILSVAKAILNKDDGLSKFLPVFRDYYLHPVYVDDIGKLMNIVALRDHSCSRGSTYIISGEEYVTMEHLFLSVAALLKKEFRVGKRRRGDRLYLSLKKEYMRIRGRADLVTYLTAGGPNRMHRAYSTEKAEQEFAFSPEVNLKDGISRTLEWARGEGLL